MDNGLPDEHNTFSGAKCRRILQNVLQPDNCRCCMASAWISLLPLTKDLQRMSREHKQAAKLPTEANFRSRHPNRGYIIVICLLFCSLPSYYYTRHPGLGLQQMSMRIWLTHLMAYYIIFSEPVSVKPHDILDITPK